MTAIIQASRVNFRYPSSNSPQVLKNLSLTVNAGELVTLLGPNGAGKTTIINLLTGWHTPNSGTVKVIGLNPRLFPPAQLSQIGLLTQEMKDFYRFPLQQFYELINAHHQSFYNGKTALPKVKQMLEKLGLFAQRNQRLAKLSSGQQRLAYLGAALLGNPKVIILDEPTTNLDPQIKNTVHEILQDLTSNETSILLCTHDLLEAQKIADRVAILNQGKILVEGSPHEISNKIKGLTRITWREDGQEHVHETTNPDAFLAKLNMSAVTNLNIARPDLEDAYLSFIQGNSPLTPKEGTQND